MKKEGKEKKKRGKKSSKSSVLLCQIREEGKRKQSPVKRAVQN